MKTTNTNADLQTALLDDILDTNPTTYPKYISRKQFGEASSSYCEAHVEDRDGGFNYPGVQAVDEMYREYKRRVIADIESGMPGQSLSASQRRRLFAKRGPSADFSSAAFVVKNADLEDLRLSMIGDLQATAHNNGHDIVILTIGGYFTHHDADRVPHIVEAIADDTAGRKRAKIEDVHETKGGYEMVIGVDASPADAYRMLKQYRDTSVQVAREERAFERAAA